MKHIFLTIGLFWFAAFNAISQKCDDCYRFPTEESNIFDICFTCKGGAIGIADGKAIRVFSMVSKDLIREFTNGHTGQILSIDISKDSTLMVSGGTDSTVVIWNFTEGKTLKKLRSGGIITSVCLSPDNRYLAFGGSDKKVTVYDIAEDKVINVLSDHFGEVTAVVFSHDGRYIASAGADGLINIYENVSLVKTFSEHKDWIRDISFDYMDAKLLSCGDDGTIILYNISDIRKPWVMRKENYSSYWIASIDFNQDNVTYAFGDIEGRIEITCTFGSYIAKLKDPILKIRFKPEEDYYLKLAVATKGNGVLIIEGKDMKSK